MKKWLYSAALAGMFLSGALHAHCQMPCGIYHDDMVFDQIDQYVETMYKGISVINNSKFDNAKERNEFIRWVIEKEHASNEAASLIMKYFLQQKIKAGEETTPKQLASAHRLLLLIVSIKQNVSLDMVHEFQHEWESFKLMFHRESYECDMEKIRIKEDDEKRAKQDEQQSQKQPVDNAGNTPDKKK